MIRTTVNESTKTVTRTVLGQTYETVCGSSDGVEAVATAELTEVGYLAADSGNTYTIVPSNEHNP
jgi:hypothetical protein